MTSAKTATAASAVPESGVTAATSGLPKWAAIHDAAQQARVLRQVLQDDKQRIGCFLGAGCPLGIYDCTDKKSIVLIPAVVELTKRVFEALEEADNAAGGITAFKKQWDALSQECKRDDGWPPTVEDILTELRTLSSRRGSAEVLGMSKDALQLLDQKICSIIADQMKVPLPGHRTSYNRFASWIAGVSRDSPVEIFTPNYDLLFEQAFEQQSLPHFDGFVGSREPWFDLASIEHDTVPARWIRLWKLHGSINWERKEQSINGAKSTRVVRVTGIATAGKVMIYPSHLKYDQSRRMPYLAMLDRLRGFFHGGNRGRLLEGGRGVDDAPRLVICGYSFLDEHLNEVLLDGLRGNRNAHCFALMYSNLADHPRVIEYAQKQGNLTVLAKDGAVIGTRIGRYRPGTSGGSEHEPWLIAEPTASGMPDDETKCNLGDFHYFGLFLEELCGGRFVDANPTV